MYHYPFCFQASKWPVKGAPAPGPWLKHMTGQCWALRQLAFRGNRFVNALIRKHRTATGTGNGTHEIFRREVASRDHNRYRIIDDNTYRLADKSIINRALLCAVGVF